MLFYRWSLILFFSFFSFIASASEESVCAEVRIQIVQELTLERQGFEATLEIENVLEDQTITNIAVDVTFANENGETVKASSNPDASDAQFFIRVLNKDNIDDVSGLGNLAAKQKATVTWLIVPVPGSGGSKASGKLYWVGATFNYLLDGNEGSIPVKPDSIFVKPMPTLTLDYFLPKDIYADDPFTPQTEAIEPFNLGVLIRNSGQGPAKDVKIDSAQPEIVENLQGLKIGFKLTGAQVDNQNVTPSLLINFGDIASGTAKSGRWVMETTLSGEFKNFKASFSHASELGGTLTSLIDAVNTHTLVSNVISDLPGQDMIPDFLADDAGQLNLYDTAGSVTPVNKLITSLTPTSETSFQYSANNSTTPVLAQFSSPNNSQLTPTSVTRSDGKTINPLNVWVSKTQDAETRAYTYTLNIFEMQSSGTYNINYKEQSEDSKPPQFSPVSLIIAIENKLLTYRVTATDPEKDLLTFTSKNLPQGATVETLDANSANILWTANSTQLGKHNALITVSDTVNDVSTPLFFEVRSADDIDADGLSDEWEMMVFGSLDQDAHDDFDNDGLTNLEELQQQKNPTIPDGPTAPTIITPINNEVMVLQPNLVIRNGEQTGPHSVIYEFEVFSDEGFTQLVDAYYSVEESLNGVTQWSVSKELQENTSYFWRVRANNSYISSLYQHGQFFVNQINEAPTAPVINSPLDNSEVSGGKLTFNIQPSSDVDNDMLRYQMTIFGDEALTTIVELSPYLIADENNNINWLPSAILTPATTYYWSAIAYDEHDLASPAITAKFSVINNNQPPLAPEIVYPLSAQRVASATPKLSFNSAVDPDGDTLQYQLQLDTSDHYDSIELIDITLNENELANFYQTQTLLENTLYYWRIKAIDPAGLMSPWSSSSFFVNAINSEPPAVSVKNPGEGAWVASLTPQLAVYEVNDIDLDSVSYEFALFDAQNTVEPIWSGTSDSPDTVIPFTLVDNQWYYWQARAVDEQQVTSPWLALQSFFTDENAINDQPIFTWLNENKTVIVRRNKNIKLTWQDSDPDSNAEISLYYIKEGEAIKHMIVEQLSENKDGGYDSYNWAISSLDDGVYHVYATISDEANIQEIEAPFIIVASKKYIQQGHIKNAGKAYLILTENGDGGFVEFVLSRPPFTEVNVKVTPSDTRIKLLNDILTFSPSNWSVPQKVNVTVEDDCKFKWYQGFSLKPQVIDSKDPSYRQAWYPSIRGHVINDEPRLPFSKFIGICSFEKVSSVAFENGYLQTYKVRVKSKHNTPLNNLMLTAKPRNNSIKMNDNTSIIDNINSGDIKQLTDFISFETSNNNYIPAHQFNWSLETIGTMQ